MFLYIYTMNAYKHKKAFFLQYYKCMTYSIVVRDSINSLALVWSSHWHSRVCYTMRRVTWWRANCSRTLWMKWTECRCCCSPSRPSRRRRCACPLVAPGLAGRSRLAVQPSHTSSTLVPTSKSPLGRHEKAGLSACGWLVSRAWQERHTLPLRPPSSQGRLCL